MTKQVRYIFLASAILSLAYFIIPSVYSKPLPIWSLALLAYTTRNAYSSAICSGLIFSSLGDIVLQLDHVYPNAGLFIIGLAAFLIAHILYIRAFSTCELSFKHTPIVLIPVTAYSMAIMTVLLPRIETGLIIPVLLYGFAISIMLFLSLIRFLSKKSGSLKSRTCALIGSLVFVLSDSILAINKFAAPVPNAHFFIMLTYYFGQTYIAASTVQSIVKND